jgi:hypothetical protein
MRSTPRYFNWDELIIRSKACRPFSNQEPVWLFLSTMAETSSVTRSHHRWDIGGPMRHCIFMELPIGSMQKSHWTILLILLPCSGGSHSWPFSNQEPVWLFLSTMAETSSVTRSHHRWDIGGLQQLWLMRSTPRYFNWDELIIRSKACILSVFPLARKLIGKILATRN